MTETSVGAEQAVEPLLSVSERERLAQIKVTARRREYLLSRALMRHALSRRFQCPESTWEIVDQTRAKPVVGNLPEDIHRSLSHSKGAICFALSNAPLGVDIEASARQRKLTAMAKLFMNADEIDRFQLNRLDRAEYFYRLWCAKEAYYKLLSPERQADTLFTGIDYSRVKASESGRFLNEGRLRDHFFAAVTLGRVDLIEICYFDSAEAALGQLVIDDTGI